MTISDFGAYSLFMQEVYYCGTNNGSLRFGIDSADAINQLTRHEMFHGIQDALLRASPQINGVTSKLANRVADTNWIVEGTAAVAETSTATQMNKSEYYGGIRKIQAPLIREENREIYQVADFYVYLGRIKNQGIRYLRPFFETGLRNPITDVNAVIRRLPAPQISLADAYWAWIKNQGIQYTGNLDFWDRGAGRQDCTLDLDTPLGLTGAVNPPTVWQPNLPATPANIITRNTGAATSLESLNTAVLSIEPPAASVPALGAIGLVRVTGGAYKVYQGLNDSWTFPNCRPPTTVDGNANGVLVPIYKNSRLLTFISNTNLTTNQNYSISLERIGFTGNATTSPANVGTNNIQGTLSLTNPITTTVRYVLEPSTRLRFVNPRNERTLTSGSQISETFQYDCLSSGVFNETVTVLGRVRTTFSGNGNDIAELEITKIPVTITCQERPSTSSRGLGGSGGEPWLRTFDNNFIGFHAIGEFILAQNPTSGLNVQVRYVKGSETAISDPTLREEVSFNAAVAMQVGSDRVAVYAIKGKTPCCTADPSNQAQVRINGQIIAPPSGLEHDYLQVLPGGGHISWFGSDISIISPNGNEIVQVALFDNHVGSVSLSVPASARGQYHGLLGNFDDTASNDFQTRSGVTLAAPLSTGQLYLEWKVLTLA